MKRSELLQVLEFYANQKNWQSPSTGFAAQYDPEPSPIDKDKGLMARLAIKSLEDGEV